MVIWHTIYKRKFGIIPKDANGRSYEIHHIDGDHSNNHIDNLKAITIQEHYDIHLSQGDHGACYLIAKRIRMSPEIISEHNRLASLKRVADGTHNFLGGEISKKITKERLENGTHNFLGGKLARKRVAEGTHNFLEMVKNGTHVAYIIRTCPHCGKTGKGSAMFRWHFNRCKEYKGESTNSL